MGITWSEEPAFAVNNVLTDDFFAFPQGYPFTKKNVLRFVHAVVDGTIRNKKLKLPDSRKTYLEHLKHAVKISEKKFENA